jgi:hypothetical protein
MTPKNLLQPRTLNHSLGVFLSTATLLLFPPILALAKDCGIYYTLSGTSNLDAWRDLRAVSMWNDNGGTMNEVGLVNGHKPNMCSVCWGARGSTRDYERTVSQDSVAEQIKYTVR